MKTLCTGVQIALLNIILNTALALAKLIAGFTLHSTAMLSDGAHSVADALSGIAVVAGIRLSTKHTDSCHPYGYERMECVAAVVLSIIIGVTGVGIGVTAAQTLLAVHSLPKTQNSPAWVVALGAIAVKEIMFRYTRCVARKTGSAALMADAWHQRTDALSSVGGLIGVIGANMGVAILDPLAGIAIALLIVKAAVGIFSDAMRKMTDHACDDAFDMQVTDHVKTIDGVCDVVSLKTRLFGSRVLAEITVRVQAGLSAEEAYAIALAVKQSTEATFEELKSCAVHIHPSEISLCDCKTGTDVV